MIRKMKITICLMLVILWFGSAYTEGWSSKLGVVGGVSNLYELELFTGDYFESDLELNYGGCFGIQYSLRKWYFGFSFMVKYFEFKSEGNYWDSYNSVYSTHYLFHRTANFRIVSMDLGLDVFFQKTGRCNTFITGFVSLNTFGFSRIVSDPIDPPDTPVNYGQEKSLSVNIRFGTGFRAGVQYSITDWFEIRPSLSYETFNLDRGKYTSESEYDDVLLKNKASVFSFMISTMFLL